MGLLGCSRAAQESPQMRRFPPDSTVLTGNTIRDEARAKQAREIAEQTTLERHQEQETRPVRLPTPNSLDREGYARYLDEHYRNWIAPTDDGMIAMHQFIQEEGYAVGKFLGSGGSTTAFQAYRLSDGSDHFVCRFNTPRRQINDNYEFYEEKPEVAETILARTLCHGVVMVDYPYYGPNNCYGGPAPVTFEIQERVESFDTKDKNYSILLASLTVKKQDELFEDLAERAKITGWGVNDNKDSQCGRKLGHDYAKYYDWDVSHPPRCPNGEPRQRCCSRSESVCRTKWCHTCNMCSRGSTKHTSCRCNWKDGRK